MTIKKLKEMIADLPDDMRVYADDSAYTLFGEDNSEFVRIAEAMHTKMAVFQTKYDIDVEEEIKGLAEYAQENSWSDADFYTEAIDLGFTTDDFSNPEIARLQMEECGLI